MNIRYILLSAALATLALGTGCRKAELEAPSQDTSALEMEQASEMPNRKTVLHAVRLKFAPNQIDQVERIVKEQAGKPRMDLSSIPFLKEMKAVYLYRVFPYAGKFEPRTRREGMHLWYDVVFEREISTPAAQQVRQRAIEIAQQSSGVDIVELIRIPRLPKTSVTELSASELSAQTRTSGTLPTDDPLLSKQWHYHNDGTLIRAKRGADINLYKAWGVEMGRSDVIVSIVDGGIDVQHEDLRENLFINTAEMRGVSGRDDDGNGFVDDVYGYNFALEQGRITPHSHGTHVAGTVAARSNNNRGVAGVAGGDGSPGSGVRLMSCQTFHTDPTSGQSRNGGFEAAIKYGADNGAVISQNSWGIPGYEKIDASLKDAVDYFIKYAGCDNDGNQLPGSPMKGGVVIFAAGNDGLEYRAMPSAYAPIISVAAMSTNFEASPYTNRGTWVTIMAPGGDIYQHNGQVLSTLPGGSYGYMQGTSMACPHVSGVAALIVSEFGKMGFTNEELKKRLTTAILSEDINRHNPRFSGRLGIGYVDAFAAVTSNPGAVAPKIPQWQSVEVTPRGLEASWLAVEDADDEKAFGYKVYYSTQSLSQTNLAQAQYQKVIEPETKVGEQIARLLEGLEASTTYHLALTAYDRWGNESAPSLTSAKTHANRRPIVRVPQHEPIRVSGDETIKLPIEISDPDGDTWNYEILGSAQGTIVRRTDKGLELIFRVVAYVGEYTLRLKISDQHGASEELSIPFEIYRNAAPSLERPFAKRYLPQGKAETSYDLDDFFTDPDGDELVYTVKLLDNPSVRIQLTGSRLTIREEKLGPSVIVIEAVDPRGQKAVATLQLEIVPDEIVHLVYPTPVLSTLNVRVAEYLRSISLRILGADGRELLSQRAKLAPGNQIVKIQVSKLSPGTYTLYAEAEGKIYRQTFIKR